MAIKRDTIAGPWHGIMTDVPPTVDSQGFEDVVNMIGFKGRLRSRPGLNIGGGFTSPDLSPILNMGSFQDIETSLHTFALTAANAYMLTAGFVFNLLSYPTFVKSVTLNQPGINYSVGDILNLEQSGASEGSVIVQTISTGGISVIQLGNLPGTGYTVGDVINILQGTATSATAVVTAISGGGATGPVSAITLTNAGSGYTSSTAVSTGGGTGTGLYLNIASGGSISTALVSTQTFGGTGYTVGDVLTVVAPGTSTGIGGQLKVLTIGGSGSITTVEVLTPGFGYSNTNFAPVTGGSGTNAGFVLTTTSIAVGIITSISLNDPGTGYTTATNLSTFGGTGTGATVDIITTSIISLGGATGTNLPYAVVKANNCVYFSNGSVPVCYLDGEAGFKIAGNVPGSCRFLTANAGHLLGAYWTEPDPTQSAAITFPNRLRGSDSSNYNQWDTASLSFDAFVDDIEDTPDDITGLSTLGTNSYIYRTNGISIATPTGISSEPFYIRNYSLAPKGEGCAYPYSLATHMNIDRFIGNYDVWAFDGANFTPLMDKKCNAKFFADLANQSGLYQVRGIITVAISNSMPFLAYMITIPGANVTWCLNITEGSWTRLSWAAPADGDTGYYDLQFIEQVYTS